MLDATKTSHLQDLLENARSIFVMYGSRPSNDDLAAALGLYQVLSEAGKDVKLVAPRTGQSKLPLQGLQVTTAEIGNQNLTISFEYSETAVDKVSYHISDDNSRFFLTVKPKQGEQPLNANSVKVAYSGAEVDLIFTVGVKKLEELGALYEEYRELFEKTETVVVAEQSAEHGSLQLTLTDEVSLSQLVAGALLDLGYRPSAQSATNLLAGIEHSTGNLQSTKTTAETFEVVARLLRAGADRLQQQQNTGAPQSNQEQEVPRAQLKSQQTEVSPAKSDKARK